MNSAWLAMLDAPRCLARNRRGSPCLAPALRGKRRCRLHGGHATGPPKGNRNALKHGVYSGQADRERRQLLQAVDRMRGLLREL